MTIKINTASIFDMYGPNARISEKILAQALLGRFDHDPPLYHLYRGAYAVAARAYFPATVPMDTLPGAREC